MAEDRQASYDGRMSPTNERLLARLEAKLEAVERGIERIEKDQRERFDRVERDIHARLDGLEKGKADGERLRRVEVVVFGFVSMVLVAFAAGLIAIVLPERDGRPGAGAPVQQEDGR